MKTVIRARIVFSRFGFHNSWLNNRTIKLFIIKMCFLRCSQSSLPPQHIHLLKTVVCRDVNEDMEQQ